MQVLNHHIYEYKKGLRNLVLHTMKSSDITAVELRLKGLNVAFFIQHVTEGKVNIFFGKEECVAIIKGFGQVPLNEFTDEQDFILGTMLGYDRMQQCERYLKRHSSQEEAADTIDLAS